MWSEHTPNAFTNSPELGSDNSLPEMDINMESVSDEDFMTQLSADLDIPLLLSPGEDEMAVLNSFLDQSSDEILSNIAYTQGPVDNMDIKELDFLHTTKEENCPEEKNLSYFEYLNGTTLTRDNWDIKSEEHSDESCSSRNSLEPSTPPPILPNKKRNSTVFFPKKENTNGFQVVPQAVEVPVKRVPIKPKVPCTVPANNSNIVFLKNISSDNVSSNIVILDTLPVNTLNPIAPSIVSSVKQPNKPASLPSFSVCPNKIGLDPKILKRQERRIKNRESASISRKKKRDYLNSLEEKVKDLTIENQQLKEENTNLKERLSFYERSDTTYFHSISHKTAKPALVLCVFLLVVGLNFNLGSNTSLTWSKKTDPLGSDIPKLPDHYGRNLLWAQDDEKLENNTYFSPLTMCPASINQTESARLMLELEKWIGQSKPIKNEETHLKPLIKKTKTRRRKMRIDSSLTYLKKRDNSADEVKNEVQVFTPKVDQIYSEFFEAINRQDDTFYVVSFSEQHMLLPALHHNKTRRPKMSLLMPSVFSNETSAQMYIPLMKIDCEVLDTQLVNIKYGAIPRPYRHYNNFTKGANAKRGEPDPSQRKYDAKKAYKPYFLSKNMFKVVDFD